MTSQTLREARKYEEATEKIILEHERPLFHLSARIGWLNDPNGFSFYQGQYHMFYQYHPYSVNWGPMHWGHAVSEDLLHWTYLPAALAPDSVYDRDGCFSGSAIELKDGRQLLMYTGVVKTVEADGSGGEVQTQCIAVGDGIDYEKDPHNPVILGEDLPEGFSRKDFRDPKLYRRPDGSLRCIAGNRPADGSGQLLLFGCDEAEGGDVPSYAKWRFLKVLVENRDRFGKMWECPDFFPLDGKQVVLASPQDMLPQGFEYHNGDGTLCLIGSFDEETETFTPEHDQAIDYGIDFYATQTLLTEDGRRVMIGWMQNWDTCSLRTSHEKWNGQMSLPRELFLKNGRLYQRPVRELEALRGEKVEYSGVPVEEGDPAVLELPGIRGRCADLEVEIAPKEGEEIYQKFAIHFARNEKFHTSVSFRPRESVLKIDRKFSGSRRAIIHQRRSLIPGGERGKIKLRLILDRYSAEIFVNDGEQVLSATFYTPLEADGISFVCFGKARINTVFYPLG